MNGTNPESRALTWLIYGDDTFNTSALLTLNVEMETEVSFRVCQRYVLVILWFQQADESGVFVNNWRNTTVWLNYSNECEWYGIDCEIMNLGVNVGSQQLTFLTHLDFSRNAVGGTFCQNLLSNAVVCRSYIYLFAC